MENNQFKIITFYLIFAATPLIYFNFMFFWSSLVFALLFLTQLFIDFKKEDRTNFNLQSLNDSIIKLRMMIEDHQYKIDQYKIDIDSLKSKVSLQKIK